MKNTIKGYAAVTIFIVAFIAILYLFYAFFVSTPMANVKDFALPQSQPSPAKMHSLAVTDSESASNAHSEITSNMNAIASNINGIEGRIK